MKNKRILRSPLFYVGDKSKLIDEISTYFPTNINKFIEPFVGGGSVFLNIKANKYCLNDIDKNIIEIHKYLCSNHLKREKFFKKCFRKIEEYGLSCSLNGVCVPEELKAIYKKTYYAVFNKAAYIKLRNDYNSNRNILLLYLLLIYGFNHMIRFNAKGEFNLPVGNVDFNKNVNDALNGYFDAISVKQVEWHNLDFRKFLKKIQIEENDFVYLDPPYLITFSEYNKLWNEEIELELLSLLDELNNKNVKFAISNVTKYKGKENSIFIEWSKKYNLHNIKSNYISYHDNTIKDFNEVLITNY